MVVVPDVRVNHLMLSSCRTMSITIDFPSSFIVVLLQMLSTPPAQCRCSSNIAKKKKPLRAENRVEEYVSNPNQARDESYRRSPECPVGISGGYFVVTLGFDAKVEHVQPARVPSASRTAASLLLIVLPHAMFCPGWRLRRTRHAVYVVPSGLKPFPLLEGRSACACRVRRETTWSLY
jgi:hypothetical protein